MLGQRLEHVECDTRHVKVDADVLRNYLGWRCHGSACTSVFSSLSRTILAKSSSNQTSGPEQRRAHDAGTSSMCKECWDEQFAKSVVCSCHPRQ